VVGGFVKGWGGGKSVPGCGGRSGGDLGETKKKRCRNAWVSVRRKLVGNSMLQ